MINLDLEGVSDLLRGDHMQFHGGKLNIAILYEKFKVSNKDLRKLREGYYIDLAKEKLTVISSKN